jgi:hypothetical protein
LSNFNTAQPTPAFRFSSKAGLVSLALKWKSLDLFGPLRQQVKIKQKSIKYTPIAKLEAAFLNILAGSTSMVELNKLVRADQVLYQAFGLEQCAEQSVVQQTLDSCTQQTIEQAHRAFTQIYRHFSQGYFHKYEQRLQLLDIDFTGLPCGPKAALATKGYFAKARNRRGRQLGRVVASFYHEIVVDQLYAGNVQLNTSLQALLKEAGAVLNLDEAKRKRTVVRVDSGGGSLDNINWVLSQGYLYHGKDYSGQKAAKLMQAVKQWVQDPLHEGREVGWIYEPHPYQQPVRRIAVRCRKANGQWGLGVIVSSLSNAQVSQLLGWERAAQYEPQKVLLGLVYFYDQRGGGIETEIKQDKQGLGLGTRNKKRFEGQQMLVLLGALAHNVLVWSRQLMKTEPTEGQAAEPYGMYRMVRDILTMNGLIWLNVSGQITQIVLNQLDPFARNWLKAFDKLLSDTQVGISLGQT